MGQKSQQQNHQQQQQQQQQIGKHYTKTKSTTGLPSTERWEWLIDQECCWLD